MCAPCAVCAVCAAHALSARARCVRARVACVCTTRACLRYVALYRIAACVSVCIHARFCWCVRALHPLNALCMCQRASECACVYAASRCGTARHGAVKSVAYLASLSPCPTLDVHRIREHSRNILLEIKVPQPRQQIIPRRCGDHGIQTSAERVVSERANRRVTEDCD